MTTTQSEAETGAGRAVPESEVHTATWGPAPEGPPPRGGHQALSLALPLLIAGAVAALLFARGRTEGAVVLVAVVVAVTAARALSPAFDRRFLRGLEAFGRGVGHVLRWVLLGTMFVFVFVPLAVLQWLFRSTPLGRPRGFTGDGWIPTSVMAPDGPPRRTFGSEPTKAPGAKTPKVVVGLAVIAVLLVADLAVGTLFTATGSLPPIDRGDLVTQINQSLDRDMANPPINDEPWADQHGDDMAGFELQTNDYLPYLIRAHHEYSSPTVNVTESERLSYEPEVPAGTEPLKVAFFGGSVMFGVGQRDDHTIPSAFARIAEESGVPVEVHNYGFPGWVIWQEYQLMERLLASGEEYDMVVFFDGFNEFDVQMSDYSAEPTHHSAVIFNGLATDFRDQRASEPEPLDGLGELAESYRRASGAWRVWDTFTGRDAPLPGLDGAVSGTPEQQTDAALDIYGRAKGLTEDLATDYDVPVRFFWQPRAAGWPPEVLERLPDGVDDLSNVFGGDPSYFYDVVHTDEVGAELIAQAMWDELGPELTAMAGGTSTPPVTVPVAAPAD
ncbi:MAG: SGNH/GDSL hydrolase family protein [Acidimicrobiales bacterium]|nr:SGNH/GDSL hydrolase family protein [Acidimicrobiales bacterium]